MDNENNYCTDDLSNINDSSEASIITSENRKCNIRDILYKRIPILQWLPHYSLSILMQDFLAGFTVGLTAIPQGIAYAVVAGIEPQYGLYSGVMACFVYMFFGSCKDINIGPTAIMALMIQQHTGKFGPDIAVLMCFISGCIIFLFGLLNLGFLVQFISYPVTAGFTSAAAITIGSAQIKSLLGIKGPANKFLESWLTVINHIKEVRWQDTTLGLCSILILLCLKFLRTFGHRESDPNKTRAQNIRGKIFWILPLAGNALVVLIGSLIAYIFYLHGEKPFQLTDHVTKGLPPFRLPPFNAQVMVNNTIVEYTFLEMMNEVQIGILTIPVIAILESVAVAKSFAKGKTVDATQEMVALGLSNICGSFFRSMPATGSFTRTAVNNAAGVRTPLGGVFTASLVLLALSFLTSAFYFIPKATLAGVIITAMIFMLEAHAFLLLWKTKKLDLLIYIITVLSCLFTSLEIGIVIGIGVNALCILYGAARPQISVEFVKVSNKRVLCVTPSQSLLFPSAEYIRETVIATIEMKQNSLTNISANEQESTVGGGQDENRIIVVLDGHNVLYIDSTVAKNLKVLVEDLELRKHLVIFWRWSRAAENVCCGLDFKLAELFVRGTTLEQAITERENSFLHEINVTNHT